MGMVVVGIVYARWFGCNLGAAKVVVKLQIRPKL